MQSAVSSRVAQHPIDVRTARKGAGPAAWHDPLVDTVTMLLEDMSATIHVEATDAPVLLAGGIGQPREAKLHLTLPSNTTPQDHARRAVA